MDDTNYGPFLSKKRTILKETEPSFEFKKPKPKRKPIQISSAQNKDSNTRLRELTCLCDDGTIWILEDGETWRQLKNIPNDD